MSGRTGLVVGTRGSRLALVQTGEVVARIREMSPGLDVSVSRIVTAGDRDQRTHLDRMGVAVFVKELEEALLDRRIDVAVHSLKDVPTEMPPGLGLLAVLERGDPRDTLVASAPLDELATGLRIGTDSLRRSIQLARCRPEIQVCGIRGNVDTRLRKVSAGEYDGVIVAAAALARLGWEDRITQYLSYEDFLPAVGQGALVVEGRAGDVRVAGLVSPVNHLPTWQSVTAERAFLHALGGGCRAPIAALGTVSNGLLRLEGMVASVSRKEVLRAVEEGGPLSAEELGVRLAERLLDMGADAFIDEVRGR